MTADLPINPDYMRVDDGSAMMEIGQAHPHGEWIEIYARP